MSAGMKLVTLSRIVRSFATVFHGSRFARNPTAVLCLGCLGLAAGCGEPPPAERLVQGQIFIVSAEGQVFRLGSVEVRLFDEREVDRYLDRAAQSIGERRRAAERDLAANREETRRLKSELAAVENAYRARNQQVREELALYLEAGDARVKRMEGEIAANEKLIAGVAERPSPPPGIPSREEYEEFAQRRSQWFSMSAAERESWAEVLVLANRQIRANIEELKKEREERLDAWSEDLRAHAAAVERLMERADASAAAEPELQRRLDAIPHVDDYLADLPEPFRKLRTDADGEFEAVLPAGKRFGLYANASRFIDGEVRDFQWLVWVDTGRQPWEKILLSNHNRLFSGAPENILAAKSEAF